MLGFLGFPLATKAWVFYERGEIGGVFITLLFTAILLSIASWGVRGYFTSLLSWSNEKLLKQGKILTARTTTYADPNVAKFLQSTFVYRITKPEERGKERVLLLSNGEVIHPRIWPSSLGLKKDVTLYLHPWLKDNFLIMKDGKLIADFPFDRKGNFLETDILDIEEDSTKPNELKFCIHAPINDPQSIIEILKNTSILKGDFKEIEEDEIYEVQTQDYTIHLNLIENLVKQGSSKQSSLSGYNIEILIKGAEAKQFEQSRDKMIHAIRELALKFESMEQK